MGGRGAGERRRKVGGWEVCGGRGVGDITPFRQIPCEGGEGTSAAFAAVKQWKHHKVIGSD